MYGMYGYGYGYGNEADNKKKGEKKQWQECLFLHLGIGSLKKNSKG